MPKVKGWITVREDWCKGCELCTTVCPKDLLHMAGRFNARGYHPVELVDPQGECTGCALCALICPEAIITVYRQTVETAAVAA